MIRDPRADAHRDRIARRIIAAESFGLSMAVHVYGWSPTTELWLDQISLAWVQRHIASRER